MRKLACLLCMLVGMMSLGGCFASPGYSGAENWARTTRTWNYEAGQAVDDAMYELMFWPPSNSTRWQLR
jgi:hypothetical protein